MGRFSSPQDPLFQRLNSSVSFDYRLAPYDLEQSGAHARMLASREIISRQDLEAIESGLATIRREIDEDTFEIQPDDEDIHMAIERRLIELVGPPGGKLHTARSRNDQVATDVTLFVRSAQRSCSRACCRSCSSAPRSTSTGACRATRTSSAPSLSTSRTTCSRGSGSSAATSTGSTSACARAIRCRSAPARSRASTS
jgi:hypothetical protein